MPDIRVQLTLGRVERPIDIELVLQMSEHLFNRGVVQTVTPATYLLAPFPVGHVRAPHGRELGRLVVWMGCFQLRPVVFVGAEIVGKWRLSVLVVFVKSTVIDRPVTVIVNGLHSSQSLVTVSSPGMSTHCFRSPHPSGQKRQNEERKRPHELGLKTLPNHAHRSASDQAGSPSRATCQIVMVIQLLQNGRIINQFDKLFGILRPKHAGIHDLFETELLIWIQVRTVGSK